MTAYERLVRYRARHPERRAEQMERAKARNRALTRLARLHPCDFEVLYAFECEQAGITPARPQAVRQDRQ